VLAKNLPRSTIVVVLVLAVALSGCSMLGRKKKPDTTYQESPVDQLYDAGAEKLDNHRWAEGITYFKEVERQHPYSEWSRRAIMMQAYAHYEANQYDEAIADANRFIELYPGNPSAAYAYYIKAECYFEQILDVGRDQAATEQALTSMREVARRYPHSEYAQDARLKVDMVNDQLAGKEMTIGRWYLRQGDTVAAIGRFKTVVEKYQTTTHTPEALYRLVEAYLTLGLIEEAKRNAAVLGFNFPGDIWYADAYKLMTQKGFKPEVEPTGKPRHGLFSRAAHMFTHDEAKASTAAPPLSDAAAAAALANGSAPVEAPKKKRHWFSLPAHGEPVAPAPTATPEAPPASALSAPTPPPTESSAAAAPTDGATTEEPAKKKRHWFSLPHRHPKTPAAVETTAPAPAAAPAVADKSAAPAKPKKKKKFHLPWTHHDDDENQGGDAAQPPAGGQ
jgi:outer membrane protein assembly factor BamD